MAYNKFKTHIRKNIRMKLKHVLYLILIISSQLITGCSFSISSFSDNLGNAVKANNDTETVIQALPAYLILLDSLIENDPEDEDLLIASSKLMNAYSALLAAEIEMLSSEDNRNTYYENKLKRQQKKLVKKSLNRISEAICLYDENLCSITSIKYSEFSEKIKNTNSDDIEILYQLGTSWASWLQVNTDDWNAMAQLPQIKLIMKTVNTYDEGWDNAGANMYLGVLNSFIPVTLGGNPEVGKEYFEKAILLTEGKNQMVKVLYAEYYSRLTFNASLHEKLITDVLNYEELKDEYTLINTIARQKAKALQASSKDYF